MPVYRLTTEPQGYPAPEWCHIVYGCHQLSEKQLEDLSSEHSRKYTYVIKYCESFAFLYKAINSSKYICII